jgi:hypothetical protein
MFNRERTLNWTTATNSELNTLTVISYEDCRVWSEFLTTTVQKHTLEITVHERGNKRINRKRLWHYTWLHDCRPARISKWGPICGSRLHGTRITSFNIARDYRRQWASYIFKNNVPKIHLLGFAIWLFSRMFPHKNPVHIICPNRALFIVDS